MNNGQVSPQEAKNVMQQPAVTPQPAWKTVLGTIWDFWKAYAERIAFYQTRVLLTLIYVLIAGPTWLLSRITGHQFMPTQPRGSATFWREVQMGQASNVEELTKQG